MHGLIPSVIKAQSENQVGMTVVSRDITLGDAC